MGWGVVGVTDNEHTPFTNTIHFDGLDVGWGGVLLVVRARPM